MRSRLSATNFGADYFKRSFAVAVALSAISGQADAVLITALGNDYDASTVVGSFNENEGTLTGQVFWGDSALDANVARSVSNQTWLVVRAVVAVPEPGTLFLLGLGLFGMFGLRRRKV